MNGSLRAKHERATLVLAALQNQQTRLRSDSLYVTVGRTGSQDEAAPRRLTARSSSSIISRLGRATGDSAACASLRRHQSDTSLAPPFAACRPLASPTLTSRAVSVARSQSGLTVGTRRGKETSSFHSCYCRRLRRLVCSRNPPPSDCAAARLAPGDE